MTGPFCLSSVSAAVFSDDRHHRYWLHRIWERGHPILVVCMFNPSTADGQRDDPTIRRLTAIARGWGYGGILVINLKSLRSPDPQTIRLREELEPGSTVGDAQEAAWRAALQLARDQLTPVLLAWGALAEEEDVMPFAAVARGLEFCCLGLTANGSPKHPAARGRSRVPDDQAPVPFRLVG